MGHFPVLLSQNGDSAICKISSLRIRNLTKAAIGETPYEIAVYQRINGSLFICTDLYNPASVKPDVIIQAVLGIVCLFGIFCNTLVVIFTILRFSKIQTVKSTYILNFVIANVYFFIGILLALVSANLHHWQIGTATCKAHFVSANSHDISSSIFLIIMSA